MTAHRARTIALSSAALLGYVLLACILKWPLPVHLKTHLLGDPAGDTGVYVWNLWIFSHELFTHGRSPFSTDHIFADTGGANFSLHNYAPVAGLLGAVFLGALGVVGAFNVVVLAAAALSGMATFVLARRAGLARPAAWCAGALFIASPAVLARDSAHFSLTMVAALPLFLWALLRTLDSRRTADAVLLGVTVALATYSDAYFAIFSVLMGAFVVLWRFTRLEVRPARPPRGVRTLDVAIAGLGVLIGWRVANGPATFYLGTLRIGLNTLYTPVLLLTLGALLRLWFVRRPAVRLERLGAGWRRLVLLALVAIAVTLVLLLPSIVGMAAQEPGEGLPGSSTAWRSTPRGVDLLAYFVPNQHHPWFGDRTRTWLMPPVPDAFPEYAASFSLVAFVIVVVGAARGALPRMWVAFTGVFVLLSLGPFVYVAGVNTHVPGPWALLRYAPVIGLARSPGRFAIVAVLGMSLLVAFALQAIVRRTAERRGALAAAAAATAIGIALAAELTPVPRHMHSAAVPDVYRMVADSDARPGRLLELPTGVRDGTSSLGNFSALTQFYQTEHQRPLIGGYLSRVSIGHKRRIQRAPMLRALFALSEGRELPPRWRVHAVESRDAFLRTSCISHVLVHRTRAPAGLEAFAVEALRLQPHYADASYAVYTPIEPPPCERPLAAQR